MITRYLSLVAAVVLLAFGAVVSQAAEPVVLEISGKIAGDEAAAFTRSDLEAIGTAKIVTTTPWHDGAVQFEGVPLKDLIGHVGGTGAILRISALNDYAAEMPVADLEKFGPLLALKLNGEYMEVEDKGPLFVIYPYDSDKQLHAEIYYSRSVWQVNKIEVK